MASTPTEGLIEVLKLAFGKYVPKKATYPPEDDPEMYDYEVQEDDGTTTREGPGAEEDAVPEGGVRTHDAEAEAAEVQQGASQEPKPGSSKTGLKRSLRSGKVSQPKRVSTRGPSGSLPSPFKGNCCLFPYHGQSE